MKLKSLLAVLVLAAFAVSCDQLPVEPPADQVASPQLSSHAGNPVVHRASIGGADGERFQPEGNANFSLIALQKADGTSQGQWHDQLYGPSRIHVAVDCLHVVGNTAWVSGVITGSDDPRRVGLGAFTQLVDNGPRVDDLMTYTWVNWGWVCTDAVDVGVWDELFTPTNGQVKVK